MARDPEGSTIVGCACEHRAFAQEFCACLPAGWYSELRGYTELWRESQTGVGVSPGAAAGVEDGSEPVRKRRRLRGKQHP